MEYVGGTKTLLKKQAVDINRPITINDWTVSIGPKGSILHIKNPALNIDQKTNICEFSYEIFDGKNVDDNVFYYGRDLKNNWTWFIPGFGKTGLRFEQGIRAGLYTAENCHVSTDSGCLYIVIKMPDFVSEEYGCPREIIIEHRFEEDHIGTAVYLSKKDANRIPEALWFKFNFNETDPGQWKMKKTGSIVSPLNVVCGGNRRLHCIEEYFYSGSQTSIKIMPQHSPLACLGEPCLYNTNNDYGDLNQGINFLLYNNRWGTNFKQWFDDDVNFSFKTYINGTI